MDADYTKRRRESAKSLREKRWSMNSQRLEEIVAELMKPISDVRRSFDTDLSALLEEYLTEAGLRALEEGEEEGGEGFTGGSGGSATGGVGGINFAELALLLQQSACIYSRKVDYLYQHVLDVSDSLHNSTQEAADAGAEGEAQTPSRRKRKSSGGGTAGDFSPIELAAWGGAKRDGGPRPPPTLPRGYLELEPRVMSDADAPLTDYAGEPIGLISDFQVTWRLQDGLLVDELQVSGGSGGSGVGAEGGGRLRAVPLAELQAAIAAAAPPDLPPPPLSPPPPSPHSPPAPEQTEPPPEPDAGGAPLACSTPVGVAKRERKRRNDVRLEDIAGVGKMLISAEVRRRLSVQQEFSLPARWAARVVAARKQRVLAERRRLRLLHHTTTTTDFRGFDGTDSSDIGGFLGWSASEAACAASGLARRPRADSDDDGFFEQSSTGDSDDSAAALTAITTLTTLPTPVPVAAPEAPAEWSSWRDGVVARAAAAAARGVDVRQAAAAVLEHSPAAPAPPVTCDQLLRETASEAHDVARMFLATLFLANAGKVDIVQGPPLTVNSFSVRRLAPAADCGLPDLPDPTLAPPHR